MSAWTGTPGPWAVSGVRSNIHVLGGDSKAHIVLAQGAGACGRDEAVAAVLYTDRNGLHRELFANAKGIAAVPQLVDALTRALPHLETLHSIAQAKDARQLVYDRILAARAALKAAGVDL